ncbi:MAG: type II toxin-antitoxin system RelE/ParE family toxin [Nitrosospira sp.]
MSSPKLCLALSPEAQKDFTCILRYTGERWGHEQLLTYRAKLNDALLLLSQSPQLGHQAAELPDTHRLYFFGSHVIVYRTRQDATEVVRILHQRMSITRHVMAMSGFGI